MKRIISILWIACLSMMMTAQTPKQDIKNDFRFSGGSFLNYPGPKQHKLTPAPKGKKPFYISHYGRHGSRNITKPEVFQNLLQIMVQAEEQKALTPLGIDVMKRIMMIEADTHERMGELTAIGAQQHMDIMRRMVERFPEVFNGKVTITARSTTSIRSILSMCNAMAQLKAMRPNLVINQDASLRDMHHLFHIDTVLTARSLSEENKAYYDAFCQKYPTADRLITSLFSDTAFISKHVNKERIVGNLFQLASDLQDTDISNKLTLYDIFTEEELYLNWKKKNTEWYLGWSFCPTNGGKMPYSQRFLLSNIIERADSCIQLAHPGANLRYGHDTALLPLICLLGVNGYDLNTTDLEQLEQRGWVDYNMIPMAGNLQIVFYRKNPADKDVLIKVLLNENEATLPLQTDVAPYYHWNDFRNYYLQRINNYKE
ncbi:histidine-type phosphatase [uncultured Prevotella sp.]|uniref:histidine-type phosphatase n=1 Tax=uncultured Prevotella sp. TaxID=159272 RepID=UPI00258D99DB|nr:histidine-type phosphatase [uncultured Prevotella sp.]